MITREHSLASPGNAWPAGHRIGHVELQAVVSSRSGAIVYRGWDHAPGRPVAVKEYLPARLARRGLGGQVEPAGSDEAVLYQRGLAAFIDEARLLARCDHPSLLRVIDLVEAHGTAYRVMPWAEGAPLAEVRRHMAGPPDAPALRRLVEDLLGALDTWHRVAGVHGHVEPGQVLLQDDDRALLLGPGAARRVTASDAVEALMRQLEPGYAAPELLHPTAENPPGPWSDLYALALTARFALTGQPPPPAGSPPPEPLAAALQRLLPKGAPPFDGDLLQALQAAASPQAAERPQTVAQFRLLLRGAALPAADESAAHVPPPAAAPEPAPAVPAVGPPPEPLLPMASDEATASLIQRVIESIPDHPRVLPPAGARPAAAPPRVAHTPAAAPTATSAPAAPSGRRRGAWATVIALLVAAAGYSAWDYDRGSSSASRLAALPALELPAPAVPAPAPVAAAPAVPAEAPAPLVMTPAPSPRPAAPAPAPRVAATAPATPRVACGGRTEFSLYRCMQQQCAKPAFAKHAQCVQFKRTDRVD